MAITMKIDGIDWQVRFSFDYLSQCILFLILANTADTINYITYAISVSQNDKNTLLGFLN